MTSQHSVVFTLCVVLLLTGVSAISPKRYGQLKAADLGKQADDTSCYYNVYLSNYATPGYGGAFVSVQLNGNDLEDFSAPGITLPTSVDVSGWQLPVSSGSYLTMTYKASAARDGNSLLVNDINGNKVVEMDLSNQTSYTLDLGHVTCTCVYLTESECPEVRIRNEWRSLSYCEKTNFINALNTLRFTNDSEGVNEYEKFVYHHKTVTYTVLEKSLFLPWHRGFILKFEEKLRSLGSPYSCLSLPYWDSSLDFGYESSSSVYDDLGGMEYRSCLASPFAEWTDPISLGDSELTSNCVYRRAYPPSQQFAQFSSISGLDLAVVANDNYAYIFRYLVRDPHKSVHVYVAGSMATLHSPADPLFFLHHSNIDRIYATWQDCYNYDLSGTTAEQYAQVSAKAYVEVTYTMPLIYPDANDTTNYVTIEDMFDISKYNYRYTPVTRTMVKLNTSNAITELETCDWGWMSKSVHDTNGWAYRLPVHNDEQRKRLSLSRTAFIAHIEASEMDYYGAMKAQLGAECELNGGYTADDFNAAFMTQADSDHITGPGAMFKNACKLLQEEKLDALIASCYEGYSC